MCEVLAQVDPGSGSIGLLLLQISGFSIFPVPSSGATPKLPFHKAPIPLPFHYSEEAPMDINFLNIPPCSITSIFTPFLMVSFMSLRKRYSPKSSPLTFALLPAYVTPPTHQNSVHFSLPSESSDFLPTLLHSRLKPCCVQHTSPPCYYYCSPSDQGFPSLGLNSLL